MSDSVEQGQPLCERCRKAPAAVHIRRVAEAEELDLHVCKPCAAELGADPSQVSAEATVEDPLAVMLRSLDEHSQVDVCPGCGLDYQTFKKSGRLGCAACWAAFGKQLDALLLRLQGRIRHQGRSPEREGEHYERASKIKRLNDQLERAVIAEQYERAAELRDQLKTLIGAGEKQSHE